jgi:uncharacterized cupredoxin-like copper-binding protein
MKKIFLLFAVVLCASLALAGCGGGSGPSTTINVTMTDFQYSPNSFTVPAGQTITLNATNNGAVVHSFVVMKLGTTAVAPFDDANTQNVFWQTEIQPGGSVNVTFTAPSDPGEYEVVCKTPGHLEAGMKAKLIVVAGK